MKGHKGNHHEAGRHHEHGHMGHANKKMHALAGHAIKHKEKAPGSESDAEGDWDSDAAPKEMYAGVGSHVAKEAKERKAGGKVKSRVKHHVGKHEGEKSEHRADRKPRKAGGRAGSDGNPLSSANKGESPKGRTDYEPERD